MTIDERLDRLTERHEALAQTVELLAMETRELRSAIGDLRAAQEKDGEHIRVITAAIELDAENIRALARIAESHERRLSRVESDQ
jgi:hypothetical protein